MNETDIVTVGEAMPLLASIAAPRGFEVRATWASGERRREIDTIDLAPIILTHRFYKPLRDDAELFATIHIIDDGAAVAWGADSAIDMAATTIERLAEETMTTVKFEQWLERNDLTYDGAAATLGISRRLVAYYAGGQRIPRYIALACRAIDGGTTDRGPKSWSVGGIVDEEFNHGTRTAHD
jgi:hypothetical protein